ncbi:phage tail protein [Acinetobacter baumannii]|uniref:Phage tail protein n=1 Tax=Acinetobacter baumannii TaxID=470 RepID=A0A1S2G1G3_ACIBA|nr:phage tail protein [Acinetobacter baumannii]MCE6436502.1 phage tail protein [Acinetobacter baumannii]MCE6824056.1 phage tail protein [Acinetobacter baumannii]MCE6827845.1 phage tail protein [Acinetobacter baumannii]MCE6850407.1 phage tail protein [Acinetobacter baumannii]MCZ0626751.1 phage tail protein [Acinetobacter baumannii]
MKQLKLEVIFGSQDKLSPALKILSGNSNAAARALKQTKDQVKNLESQLAKIDSYEKQKLIVQQSSIALKNMQDQVKHLKAEIAQNPANNLAKSLEQTQQQLKATEAAKKQLDQQLKRIDAFRQQKQAALDTTKSYQAVQVRIADLKRQMDAQPSKKLTQEFNRASREAEQLKNRINEQAIALQRSRNDLNQYGISTRNLSNEHIRVRREIEHSNRTIDQQKQSLRQLKEEHKQSQSSLRGLTQQLTNSEREVGKLTAEYDKQKLHLKNLSRELDLSGVSVNQLATHQGKLKDRLSSTNSQLDKQQRQMSQLTRMQQNYQKVQQHSRTAMIYGVGTTAAGTAAMYQLRKPIEENKRVEIEENRIASLGLGEKATKEATAYAKAMKTFGTSTFDNLQLMRDGITAFADVHHAEMVAPTLSKMKFANEAMYGHEQGSENERKFMDMLKVIELRNGLRSEKAFQEQANIIQQVITATGGRVQAGEWLNAIKTGGVAVKGLSNEAFYYKMEPIVQELGGHRFGTSAMSAYQNIYQGRTTKRAANNLLELGLIADQSKVTHDKAGQVSFLNPGALKGAELFKRDQFAWMEQVLLPTLAEKGITSRDQIHDTIGSIFTNRNASNLFTTMYDQREQIHKNAKLNAGADNIDQLNSKAMNTTSGKELEARAKLNDAYLNFGQNILPIYTSAIEVATEALKGFNTWMQQNPTLAKLLGAGLLVIATSLVAIGGALVVFSPLILSMLSLRLLMTTVGAKGSSLGFVFRMLSGPVGILQKGFTFLGRSILWLSRLFIANPILLAVTAIAGAAYLIYQNWGAITGFFSGVWSSVKQIFSDGWNAIKSVIQSVDSIFANNPILTFIFPFIGIPRLIIANWSSISSFFSGLWNGIVSGANNLWTNITQIFSPIGTWFLNQWNSVKTNTAQAWTAIKTAVSNAWSSLVSTIQTNPILQKIMSGWQSILTYLQSLKDQMLGIGRNIIDGLISGIKSGFNGLKSLWAQINNYMPDFMRKKMDIHSPSRVMRGIGRFIVAGLEVGLGQQHGSLQKTYKRIVDTFTAPTPVTFTPGANPPDQQQTLWQRVVYAKLPEIMDQNQNIQQVLQPAEIPTIADQTQGIWQKLFKVKVPKILGMNQTISQVLQPATIPAIPDQQQNILQSLHPAIIPDLPDQKQSILQKVVALAKPIIEDAPIFKLFGQIKNEWNRLWAGLDNIADKFPERLKMLLDVQPAEQPTLAMPSFTPPQLPPVMVKPLRAGVSASAGEQASKPHQIKVEGDSIAIYVTAQPGQSTNDIAAQIRRELESYQREKEMRIRDQFWDNQ